MGCSRGGMFGMWDVREVRCTGGGMYGRWDVRDVGCSGGEMYGRWDVREVGCSECGMFAGMLDVDLQNTRGRVLRNQIYGPFRPPRQIT